MRMLGRDRCHQQMRRCGDSSDQRRQWPGPKDRLGKPPEGMRASRPETDHRRWQARTERCATAEGGGEESLTLPGTSQEGVSRRAL